MLLVASRGWRSSPTRQREAETFPPFSVFYNLPITLAFSALAFDLLSRSLTLGRTRLFKHHGVLLLVWSVGGALLALRLVTKSIDVSGHMTWSVLMAVQCLGLKAPRWLRRLCGASCSKSCS